jgi:hypothetical protein
VKRNLIDVADSLAGHAIKAQKVSDQRVADHAAILCALLKNKSMELCVSVARVRLMEADRVTKSQLDKAESERRRPRRSSRRKQ